MLPRHATERAQGVLQALCQGDEAFAAEHDMGMREAGERQPEVIEPVIERLTRDGNAERARIGSPTDLNGRAHALGGRSRPVRRR